MLKVFIKGLFPLIFALTGAFQLSEAQSVIVISTDSALRSPITTSPSGQRGGSPDTLSISPNSPFFDDFAYLGLYPDTTRWFSAPNDLTTPVISRNQAVNPPSRGVATFDGSNKFGAAYNPANIGTGITDRLLSHYIDMAPWSVSSQAKLSFFLQPAGLGEKPEATDSFYVYFRTPLPPPNDFKKVFAIGGSPQKPFSQYIIALDDPLFFHTGFQILFQAQGSQNGHLDLWHLDYVMLGLNRSGNDTTYNDRSPVNLTQSILHPFSAIPVQHYQGSPGKMQPFTVNMDNLAGQGQNVTVTAKITDPVGGTVINATQTLTATLPPYAVNPVNFSAFSDQTLSGISAYQLLVSAPVAGDIRPENNDLEEIFRIDSLFAYDDGEADASFGLNQGLGFGMKFTLSQPDSLAAVWISFVPTVNYNPVTGKATYMKDKAFRLAVWKDSHPDSLILQQIGGMKVTYGNTPNHFQRFALSTPLNVPQTFWVGIQQTDAEPLGVGFDYSYDNDAYTFWDSSGHWVNTRLGGSLMIRAEMYNTTPLQTSAEQPIPVPMVRIFPNPVTDHTIEIYTEHIEAGTLYRAEIIDLQGRLLQSFSGEKIHGPTLRLPLSEQIPGGLVIWKHEFQMPNGEKKYVTEKLLILR